MRPVASRAGKIRGRWNHDQVRGFIEACGHVGDRFVDRNHLHIGDHDENLAG